MKRRKAVIRNSGLSDGKILVLQKLGVFIKCTCMGGGLFHRWIRYIQINKRVGFMIELEKA